MPRRVAGHVEHREAQAQHIHRVALRQAREGLGHGLARGPVDRRAGGLPQRLHAAHVVAMVVRD